MSKDYVDISDWDVMPVQCPTCPFREGNHSEITEMVMERTLTDSSQICHHPATKGKKETHLCRGARLWQCEIMHKLGFLDAPTIEAWDAKRKELER